MNTKPFATTACEYGPRGFTKSFNAGTCFIDSPRLVIARLSIILSICSEFYPPRLKVFKRSAVLNPVEPREDSRSLAMSRKELVFRIGGAAGDGSASTAESLAKICRRSGVYGFAYTSYQSVIRGGHSWVQVRASEERLLSQGERPQVLIALNQPTADIHAGQVREGGAIIFDSDSIKLDGLPIAEGVRRIGFPLSRVAREYSNNALMKNTVALGAAVRLFDMDLATVESAFATVWGKKKREIVDANVRAAAAGYKHVEENGGSMKPGAGLTGKGRPLIPRHQANGLSAPA